MPKQVNGGKQQATDPLRIIPSATLKSQTPLAFFESGQLWQKAEVGSDEFLIGSLLRSKHDVMAAEMELMSSEPTHAPRLS